MVEVRTNLVHSNTQGIDQQMDNLNFFTKYSLRISIVGLLAAFFL